jgi:hypothetical protein
MPRMMPPTPSVSAMVWRRLYFLGISKGPPLIRESLHGRRHPERRDELAGDDGALLEPLLVDVHQRDTGAG